MGGAGRGRGRGVQEESPPRKRARIALVSDAAGAAGRGAAAAAPRGRGRGRGLHGAEDHLGFENYDDYEAEDQHSEDGGPHGGSDWSSDSSGLPRWLRAAGGAAPAAGTPELPPADPAGAPAEQDRLFAQLSAALERHFDNLKCTDAQAQQRLRFLRSVERIIQNRLPGSKLALFGSSVTGLAKASSDLDATVLVPSEGDSKEDSLRVLQRLISPLRGMARVDFISRARVPILKCQANGPDGLHFDISCNRPCGPCNAAIIRHFVRSDSRVAPVLFYAQELLSKAGVRDSVHGMLSSFSLNVSLIHFLQVGVQPPVLPFSRWAASAEGADPSNFAVAAGTVAGRGSGPNTDGVGSLLIGYLQWWLDAVQEARSGGCRVWVDIRDESLRQGRPPRWTGPPADGRADRWGVAIVNPVDGSHNVTGGLQANAWRRIEDTLGHLVDVLCDGSLRPPFSSDAVVAAIADRTGDYGFGQPFADRRMAGRQRQRRERKWDRGGGGGWGGGRKRKR
eukprot:TRINITY_DN13617_c0_g1_i1.p1 TRINITY_DN13617_c0_g1~~TRINITY_DN13617_c0_g1_i1.p1  ORF type:complete len:508 (+),score=102.46 TRINITY_DN13617_c0_g1_i1:101-1624(+)